MGAPGSGRRGEHLVMDMLLDLPQVAFLLGLARFILMLSILVFVHELGHFAVAKWCGIYVATFSIGFGRRLFGFRRGETDYRVSAIPLGGYVKMVGQSDMPDDPDAPEDPDEVACPDHMRFDARPVWQRIAVSAAGPAMSLAFGVFVYWVMFLAGVAMPSGSADTKIGYVVPGGPAAEAGIRAGDRVLAVDGYRPKDWVHLQLAIVGAGETIVEMELEDEAGNIRTVNVRPHLNDGESMAVVGIQYYEEFVVEQVFSGGAAAKAGMLEGDLIIGLQDPAGVLHPASALQGVVHEHMGESIVFKLRRGEEQVALPVTPTRVVTLEGLELNGRTVVVAGGPTWMDVAGGAIPRRTIPKPGDTIEAINGQPVTNDDAAELAALLGDMAGVSVPVQFRHKDRTWTVLRKTVEHGLIGIQFSPDVIIVQYGALEAIPKSFEKFADTLVQMGASLGYLFSGRVGVRALAGPIGIGRISEQAAQYGWAVYLSMVALITINLGIVNLLPIPILDGGNIVMLSLEGIRRRPLSDRAMYYLQHAGLALILSLFAVVTFNDIRSIVVDWLGGRFG